MSLERTALSAAGRVPVESTDDERAELVRAADGADGLEVALGPQAGRTGAAGEVAVDLLTPSDTVPVGRLRSADAARYHQRLLQLGTSGRVGTCRAELRDDVDGPALVLRLAPPDTMLPANEPDGLVVLDPDRQVPLLDTGRAEPVLERYATPAGVTRSRVFVELVPHRQADGPRVGRWTVEARLDGQRVGELGPTLSGRYGPVLDDVVRDGGRPGCEAVVSAGARGTKVDLALPAVVGAGAAGAGAAGAGATGAGATGAGAAGAGAAGAGAAGAAPAGAATAGAGAVTGTAVVPAAATVSGPVTSGVGAAAAAGARRGTWLAAAVAAMLATAFLVDGERPSAEPGSRAATAAASAPATTAAPDAGPTAAPGPTSTPGGAPGPAAAPAPASTPPVAGTAAPAGTPAPPRAAAPETPAAGPAGAAAPVGAAPTGAAVPGAGPSSTVVLPGPAAAPVAVPRPGAGPAAPPRLATITGPAAVDPAIGLGAAPVVPGVPPALLCPVLAAAPCLVHPEVLSQSGAVAVATASGGPASASAQASAGAAVPRAERPAAPPVLRRVLGRPQ